MTQTLIEISNWWEIKFWHLFLDALQQTTTDLWSLWPYGVGHWNLFYLTVNKAAYGSLYIVNSKCTECLFCIVNNSLDFCCYSAPDPEVFFLVEQRVMVPTGLPGYRCRPLETRAKERRYTVEHWTGSRSVFFFNHLLIISKNYIVWLLYHYVIVFLKEDLILLAF